MPKPSITATTTATVTTTVKLSPKARQMVLERCREHARLVAQRTEIDGKKATKSKPEKVGRLKSLKQAIEAIFIKEGQGLVLADGVDIDGFKLKMTQGRSKKFDQLGFMKKHGLTQADFDEFTTYEDNEPYLGIKAPGDKDED